MKNQKASAQQKATYKMGENINKVYITQVVNIQNI